MLGQKLSGRYEIVSELGRGGMGIVYRALDPLLNREVAIKVVAPSLLNPETEQRFRTEAQLVAQMDHPSIVPIHDIGSDQGSLYFVMPIVEGESLRSLLRRNALTLGTIVDMGIDIAEALDYSHGRGVIHRDIKPENVMLCLDEGMVERVRVMDFGLARGQSVTSLTKTGMLMGTMSYISPEQVQGGEVDGRTDIYALGCVLYECMAGEVPFGGEMQSVLYRVVHELPQPLRALGCQVEPDLEAIILSCLAKDPGRRPQTAGELARALRLYRTSMRDSQKMQSILLTRTMAAPRPALAPFVDREAEFGELQQRLNAACRGECQFVVVAGEPGVGKTRLLEELATLATAREIRVLHGRFVEQHGAFPFRGFCEAIQEYFRQKEAGSASGGLPDFSDLADELVSFFPMLAEVGALRTAASATAQTARAGEPRSAENRTQVFELLARTLARLSGGQPLVLLFEDLHGAEASVEALQYVALRLGATPTLIVGTYRSTEVDRRHPLIQLLESFRGERHFATIALGALGPADHRRFLSTLTGGTEIAPDLAEKLYGATEGNPFFTKELVRSLLDSGSISQDETGAWSLTGGAQISAEALPATIQQAVEGRIGRLPEELRRTLSVAAVLGRTFDYEDLEAMAREEGDGDIEQAVEQLIREGLLEEDRQSRGDRLSFTSAVVREVLSSELSRRKRRILHRRFAERLESRHAGRLERVYPELLYHYHEAEEAEKVVAYGLLHARRSLESFSPQEAIRAARTVLEFVDEDWEDRALEGEARMLLAAGHRTAGDLASALKETATAVKIFEREGATENAIAALLAAAKAAWQVRQTEETRRWVNRGMEAARAAGDDASLAQFLSLAATLANLGGDYARGSEYLAEAERLIQAKKAVPKEEVPRGGRLVVPLANAIAAREPVDLVLTEETEVFTNVFETLVATDEEGNLHPALCESWQVEEGGKVFRFTLRREISFHDGRRLTAGDIKRSFERAIRAGAGKLPPALAAIQGAAAAVGEEAGAVEGVRVSGERTLEIHLAAPLPIYPALLSDPRTAIGRPPEGAVDGPLLGTGPFRFASLSREQVVLERHPSYWKGTPANLDVLEFRAGLSAAAIARGFRAGDLDIARDLLPEDVDAILRDPRFAGGLVEAPQKFTYFVMFNTRSGPVASRAEVREALAGVARARDLVWQTLGRFAEPAVGIIPPGVLGHEPGRRPRNLTMAEARGILERAGQVDNLRLKAAVHPMIRDRYGVLLESLFATWRELGVEVAVEALDVAGFLRTWEHNEGFDLCIARWKPDVDDPDGCTHALFHSTEGQFRSYFASPETDDLLEAARREARPAVREGLYRRFENLLLDGHALVPLFHDVGYRIAGPKVRGIALTSVQPCVNYAELGKAQESAAPAVARAAGGMLRVPMGGQVKSLDPALISLAWELEGLSPIFETLVRDVGEARIEPWLAAEFQVEEGGRRYRFRLRGDITFHDGRRLTARDVRSSLERLLQAKENLSNWVNLAPIYGAERILDGEARFLEGFVIHSASEFSIVLDRPVSFFPVLLASPVAAILPEGTTEIGTSMAEGAIGTGPYRVARFQPGERLELERHPAYWRPGFPRSDRLVFDFGVPPQTILAEFRAGRYSMAADLYPDDVEALRRDPAFAAGYRESPRLSTYFAAFNIHRAPLADRELRRRLVRAVEVPRLVRQTLGSLAVPAHGLIPPGLLGHDSLANLQRSEPTGSADVRTDLQAIELPSAVHPALTQEYSAFAQEMVKALGRIGVKIKPETTNAAEFVEATEKATIAVSVGRWVADYPDADTFACVLERRNGYLGRMCGTPEVDELIARGRFEAQPEARHAIYREIEHIVAEEALLLPLFHEQVYRFVRPEVEGLSLSYWAAVPYENLRVRAR